MKHLTALGLCGATAISSATVLTFDIDGLTLGGRISQDYGDNVTAASMGSFGYDVSNGVTPDITVSYLGIGGAQDDFSSWTTGYGDLTNVAYYELDGTPIISIVFTGSNGFGAVLGTFDVGNFGGAVTLPSISVKNGNGQILWQETNVLVPQSSNSHLTFDAGGVSADVLVLELDMTGLAGASDNIGLDNISFGQEVVPEPATMLGLAAVGAWFARRKRS